MRHSAAHQTLIILLLCPLACSFGESGEEVAIPLVQDAAGSRRFIEQATAAKKVRAGDLSEKEEGVLLKGIAASKLSPGRYRFHSLLALAPLSDPRASLVELHLRAGKASRTVSAGHLINPKGFTPFSLDFVVREDAQTSLAVAWSYPKDEEVRKKLTKARARRAPKVKHVTEGLGAEEEDEFEKEAEEELIDTGGMITVEEAAHFPCRLMGCGFHIEPLSPVIVASVTPDKVVYKPEEKAGRVTVQVSNHAERPANVLLTVELGSGLGKPRAIHSGKIEVPALETATWQGPFEIGGIRWGAKLIATAKMEGWEPSTGRESFCVTDNFWEVAVVGANSKSVKYHSYARADETVRNLRRRGYNAQEFFFWAPDDFGDFTPDRDRFFGGQGAYPESVQGTKWCVEACHKAGISSVVYANLWGGGGPHAFELMRKHPDWFGQASFSVARLNDWELMYRGKVGAPNNVWLYTNVNVEHTYDAFKFHAAELIAGHKLIGWDGVRYDSWNTEAWTKKAIGIVREIVEKEVPGFRFGYNSFTERDRNRQALTAMVGGGGLIMDEEIRSAPGQGGSLAGYAHRILWQRDTIWPKGGHLGCICGSGDDRSPTPDQIYAAAVLFASGGHPYYGAPYGTRFALRYSEFIWDNRMRPVKAPKSIVTFGRDVPLFEKWHLMARTADLGGRERRFVLHLINAPKGYRFGAGLRNKARGPIRDLPVTVKLPTGAEISGVWALPFPESHRAIPRAKKDGATTFTVPEIRYWTMVVIDYESDTALEASRDLPTPYREW